MTLQTPPPPVLTRISVSPFMNRAAVHFNFEHSLFNAHCTVYPSLDLSIAMIPGTQSITITKKAYKKDTQRIPCTIFLWLDRYDSTNYVATDFQQNLYENAFNVTYPDPPPPPPPTSF